MAKFTALKGFKGLEGHVRVGQVLDTADHESLTKHRIGELKKLGLIGDYSDKMAADPRNRMRRPHREPAGMTSPNAGGITDLGWDPNRRAARQDDASSDGEPDETGTGEGNGQGAETTAPAGSSTAAIGSSSLSPQAQAPAAPTSQPSSAGRRPRGQRPA